MRNRYPGLCGPCGEVVEARAGVYSWGETWHRACFLDRLDWRGIPRYGGPCEVCGIHAAPGDGRLAIGPASKFVLVCFPCLDGLDRPDVVGCPGDTWAAMRPYQRAGAEWLRERKAGLLADPMGLGKTLQILAALPQAEACRALAVVPACVKPVWRAEAERWRPDLRPAILEGMGSFRWPEKGELVVANYELLPVATGEKGKPKKTTAPAPPGPVHLIADEAHYLKSNRAKRTAAFRGLARSVGENRGKVWLLTGTPLVNTPPELRNVLDAAGLGRKAFGPWEEFVGLFNGRKGRFGWIWGRPRAEVAARLCRVMLRRNREEVLPELPEKSYQTIALEVGPFGEVLDRIEGLWKNWIADDPKRRRGKLPPFEELSRVRREMAEARIPLLEEIASLHEEEGEALIVFSAHRAPVDRLGKRPAWEAITGDVSAERRGEIVEAFQAGELKGLALTTGAGGVGITLTRARRVLFADLPWTPAELGQCEDRAYRIGQTRGVLITRLIADHPVDRRVLELLDQKEAMIEATVEASEERGTDGLEREDSRPDTSGRTGRPGCDQSGATGEECSSRAVTGDDRSRRGPCDPGLPGEGGRGNAGDREHDGGDREDIHGESTTPVGWEGLGDVPPPGYYSVAFGDGSHRTFKVRVPTRGKWKGWAFVDLLVGPENARDYVGFAKFPFEADRPRWERIGRHRAYRGANGISDGLAEKAWIALGILADSEEAQAAAREAYAIESGKCSRCGRLLTVPASVHRGLGPKCAQRMGLG